MAEGSGPPNPKPERSSMFEWQTNSTRNWISDFGGFIGPLLKATNVAEFGVAVKKAVQGPSPNVILHQDQDIDDRMELVLEGDFTEGFVTTCWKVVDRLLGVNLSYQNLPPTEEQIESEIDRQLKMLDVAGAFKEKHIDEGLLRLANDDLMKSLSELRNASLFNMQMLTTTTKQLENQHILISFFGYQNCGKSTLLNALLRENLLSVKNIAETGLKVNIQQLPKMGRTAAETEHCERCPYLCEKLKGDVVERTMGVEAIRRRLRHLNHEVREKKLVEVPECTLHVNIPTLSLSEIPHGWSISLSDNPGFGEANEVIEQLASTSVQDSSAYVYVTNSDNIGSEKEFEFFKRLAEHDRDSLLKGRLLIAVTKSDKSYSSASQGDGSDEEVASFCEVKRRVCESVMKAAEVSFPEDEVIEVSGSWALLAKRLCCPKPDAKVINSAARELSNWPQLKQPCGQEEDVMTSLVELPKDDLAKRLGEASGIHILEQRIQKMTNGCVAIWASKITGDLCQYLQDATDELSKRLSLTKKLIQSSQKQIQEQYESYNEVKAEFEGLLLTVEGGKESPVYKAIEDAYARDLLDSDPQAKGKGKVEELLKDFETKCQDKIKSEQRFGPEEFQEDLKKFLEKAEAELEMTFNAYCTFPTIHEVAKVKESRMAERFTALRSTSSSLCDKERKSMIEASIKDDASAMNTKRGKLLEAPNLGDLKENVNIPRVTLTMWEKIKMWLRRKFRADQNSETQHEYRVWNTDLQNTTKRLLEHMQEVCDVYFEHIKPHILQYFFEGYNQNARKRIDNYKKEFWERLRREKTWPKLAIPVYRHMQTVEVEMEKLCKHLPQLKQELEKQAEEYTSR